MVNYECDVCGKIFNKKSNWLTHTINKKYPCKPIINILKKSNNNNIGAIDGAINGANFGAPNGSNNINLKQQQNQLNDPINLLKIDNNKQTNCVNCRFCLKPFLYAKNLNKHIREERCEVLRLQKQQKENIFLNLLTEEKIINQTKKELSEMRESKKLTEDNNNVSFDPNANQFELLLKQMQILNQRFEEQKKENEKYKKQNEIHKKETEKHKKETEDKIKMMTDRYNELKNNNVELKKSNEKLQNKMNKIVTKNKITNNNTNTNTNTNSHNNISNTVINNPTIKLVNFGSEDLEKINYQVFIDTIKSQGAGLYNKAIEGIHFNKDYPENQNIYISDLNRERVMVYKNEKWIIDNWDTVFPELLEKVIQFGYDKNEFLKDCDYRTGGKRFNIQMIKNGLRWYKLLDDNAPDIEYFRLDEEDRPPIDESTYADYLEMHEFRKKHPKKETKTHIKNKVKLNIYNKRDMPIDNFKQLEDSTKKTLLIEENNIL